MKKTVFGVDIEINETRADHKLSMSDFEAINLDLLNYIRDLESSEIQKRMSDISFDVLGAEVQLAHAEAALGRYGIIVFPGYIDASIIHEFRESLSEVLTKYFAKCDGAVYEDSKVLIQVGLVKLGEYSELANYSKPVMNVRQGQDQGMIDIFNADKLVPSDAQRLRDEFERPELIRLLSGGGEDLAAVNLNVYVNSAVTQTRGFHVDSYGRQLKGFVYLTDVACLEDGPYVYVKSSNKDSPYRRMNKFISAKFPSTTETPLVNPLDISPIIAPMGSLVISDQSGFHRGFPQGAGNKRMVAVMNYCPS